METIAESVLSKVAAGDQDAISECLDRYGGLVWSLARRLSPSHADAEDAVQEVFIELWRKADQFDPSIASEATFVAMVARRRLIDRHRRRARSLETISMGPEDWNQPESDRADSLELRDEAAKAARCLERLSDVPRSVLEMSIHHGASHQAISSRLNLPLGTVKSYARRSLIQLRECMQLKSFPVKSGESL